MTEPVDEGVLGRAKAGDTDAYEALIAPLRPELRLHCYRMLGSVQDAEDQLQETLLAAWRGLPGFEGRSTLRTWLYRVATHRCLNALRAGTRRPHDSALVAHPPDDLPPATGSARDLGVRPYPDALLDDVPDAAPGPDARVERAEAVSLAFVTCLQVLPPPLRAVLILRDVLGFRAAETAAMLEVSVEAANGRLKRARAALATARTEQAFPAAELPTSTAARRTLERFVDAFERGDVGTIVACLADDAWLTMPPLPHEYRGLSAVAGFLDDVTFADRARTFRLLATGANGQPAYACYRIEPGSPEPQAHGLMVIALSGGLVRSIVRFMDDATLAAFGLPRTLARR